MMIYGFIWVQYKINFIEFGKDLTHYTEFIIFLELRHLWTAPWWQFCQLVKHNQREGLCDSIICSNSIKTESETSKLHSRIKLLKQFITQTQFSSDSHQQWLFKILMVSWIRVILIVLMTGDFIVFIRIGWNIAETIQATTMSEIYSSFVN